MHWCYQYLLVFLCTSECLLLSSSNPWVRSLQISKRAWVSAGLIVVLSANGVAADTVNLPQEEGTQIQSNAGIKEFKVPCNNVNQKLSSFLGQKATIIFNMKLDDPQATQQFPALQSIYKQYHDKGLNVLAFPTEQGFFEPDDDEMLRKKATEFYQFGEYPGAVVFDKVDVLGPSAHPLFNYLNTKAPNPNGKQAITMNYEKFLIDAQGDPVRRYPRRYTAMDMEGDIKALLSDQSLPPPSEVFQRAWREANADAAKSEYAFRLNYNFYSSPNSMYRYNPEKDAR